MQRRRLVAATFVLVPATIAACLQYTTLSTTEQAATVVNTNLVTFPVTTVNMTSMGTQQIIISPASGSGDSSDVITFSENCPEYSLNPTTPQTVSRMCTGAIPAVTSGGPDNASGSMTIPCDNPIIQTATYTASFTPTAAGSSSCTVTFLDDGSAAHNVTLQGTGQLPPLSIDVSPKNLVFSDVAVAASDVETITIFNTGGQAANITSIALSPAGAPFSLANAAPGTLQPGESRDVSITCAPVAENLFTTNVVVSSNAGAPISIPVSCRGIDTKLATSNVSFNTRHNVPIEQMITISNTGTAASQIDQLDLAGTDLAFVNPPATPFGLAPGATSAPIRIRYTAATPAEQGEVGVFTITHDAGKVDNIQLRGEALELALGVNPDGRNFGGVCIGSTVSETVAVFATLPGFVTVTDVTAPSAPFSLVDDGVPNTGRLAGSHPPNGELRYEIRVTPTAEGARQDKLTVTTDIPNAMPRELMFQVEGLAAGASATAGTDFGAAVPVNTTTVFKTITLTNCSAGELTGITYSLGGDDPGEFAIVGPADMAQSLPQTGKQDVFVVMSPKSTGARNATLVFSHSEGTTNAPLTGVAIGGDLEVPDPSDSYYRCDAGGARGLGLVGLVAFGLVARRRRKRT